MMFGVDRHARHAKSVLQSSIGPNARKKRSFSLLELASALSALVYICSTNVGNGRGRKMVDECVEGEEREVGRAPVGSCEQGGQHLVHLQDTFARKDQKKRGTLFVKG